MNRDALEAHARLAALPRRAVVREPEERGPSSLVGYPNEGRKPGRPPPAESRLRVTVKPKDSTPKQAAPRKPRLSVPSKRPNQWGFRRGETLEVTRGKLAGRRGLYIGASNSEAALVVIDGERRVVTATRLRRVGP